MGNLKSNKQAGNTRTVILRGEYGGYLRELVEIWRKKYQIICFLISSLVFGIWLAQKWPAQMLVAIFKMSGDAS